MKGSEPPRLWKRVLRLVVRGEEGARIESELDELWAHRDGGRRGAKAWYRRQVLGFLLRWPLREVRGAARPSQGRRSRRALSRLFDDVRRDVRVGARRMLRSPLSTTVSLLTLGLGIGAATALFSVVDVVLLRPLPFVEPDRLVALFESSPPEQAMAAVAPGTFLDWQERATSFAALAAHQKGSLTLTGEGDAERLVATRVTLELLPMLGIEPERGRFFDNSETLPGHEQVVILSYGLWQRRFGGARVIGRQLVLGDRPYSVVGVMPRGFAFPDGETDLWLPLVFSYRSARSPDNHGGHFLGVVGRLRAGVDIEQGKAELALLSLALEEEHPEAKAGWEARVEFLHESEVADVRLLVVALFAAVALLLAIASVNVAGLLLARAAARRQEIALRTSLGAGRGRLVRQLLAENALLGLGGCLVGLLAAALFTSVLRDLAPVALPRIEEVSVDLRVCVFVLGLMLAVILALGLAPALYAVRPRIATALRESGGAGEGIERHRLRRLLVTFEVALTAVLLVGATLLAQSLLRLGSVELGFRPQAVTRARITFPPFTPSEDRLVIYDRLIGEIEALPGVVAVGTTQRLPTSKGAQSVVEVQVANDKRPSADPPSASSYEVTPGYFAAMGIPLLRGRLFAPADRAGAERVVIVSRSLASVLFSGANALGERIRLTNAEPTVERRIVGIVADVRQGDLRAEGLPQVYEPFAQLAHPMDALTVVVRTEDGARPGLRAVLRDIDSRLPLYGLQSLEEDVSGLAARERFASLLVAVFAVTSLVLVTLGLHGLMSLFVTQRRRELGIRLALGAGGTQLRWLVLRQGLRLSAAGILSGLTAAALAMGALDGLLFEVSAANPVVFFLVAAFLLVVVVVATLVPARQASRVDPGSVLR